MQELPLNGFYSGESKKLTDRRCINFVPIPQDNGSLSTLPLHSTSGVEYSLSTNFLYDSALGNGYVSSQVFTGPHQVNSSDIVFTAGSLLVTLSNPSDYNPFNLPAWPINAAPTTVPATLNNGRMATDGFNLVLVAPADNNGAFDRHYVVDESYTITALEKYTAFPAQNLNLVDVVYFGGRFLYLANQSAFNENRVYYSDIGAVDFDGLDFFSPDTLTDKLKGMVVLNNRLYLFSESKIFIYQQTANTDIPFAPSGEIECGLLNAQTKVELDGGIAFIGRKDNGPYSLYMLSGGGVQKISNDLIDRAIRPEINSTYLFTFTEKGRKFIAIRTDAICLVMDLDSGIWHERQTLGSNTWQFIGAGYQGGDNSTVIGEYLEEVDINGFTRLYSHYGQLNDNLGTELSVTFNVSIYSKTISGLVERKVITSPFNASNDRMVISELEPVCDIDYTNPDENWPEPKINIAISYDFGNTFEQERESRIGRAGNYKQRTRFFNFGYVEQAFTAMIRTLHPYPTRVIKLLARTAKGSF